MTTGWRTGARFKRVVSAWVLGSLALGLRPAPAAEAALPNGSAPEFPREVVLQPVALPDGLESVDWRLDPTNRPFLKEPQLSQQHLFRSVLRFGKDANNVFALIWDQPRHKLYLDLNRNLDLTDDLGGVFSTTNRGVLHWFPNVTLPLKMATGLHAARLDLSLFTDVDGSWLQAHLESRTLWQARVAWRGEEWQVAAVDELFSPAGPVAAKFLLLRPWAARANYVSLRNSTVGLVPFPDRLFWLGRAFQLERRSETGGETPVCKLELTPQQPLLTELTHAGKFVDYAVLRDTNGYTAVLREPGGVVQVPRGIYAVNTVWLKKGSVQAWRQAGEPLVINATAPTNCVLGGPLTNSVIFRRMGRSLLMGHEVKGADGGTYRLAQPEARNPPEFTVYHGGRNVASGRFRFG